MPLMYERQDAEVSAQTFAQFPSLMQGSNLPLVFLNTYGQPIPNDPKITTDMGIIHTDGATNMIPSGPISEEMFGNFYSLVGIELRGSTSLKFPKRGLGVEAKNLTRIECAALSYNQTLSDILPTLDINKDDLPIGNITDPFLNDLACRERNDENEFKDDKFEIDQNIPVLGMPAEEDWVLNGPYVDKTLIRNHLAYDMARLMAPNRYAPQTRLVELFLTDAEVVTEADPQPVSEAKKYKYQGVYVLTEKIKRGTNRVNIGKLKKSEDQTGGGYILAVDNIKGRPNEGFYSDYTSTGARNERGASGQPVEFLYEDPDREDFRCVSGTEKADNCERETQQREDQLNYIQRYMRDFERLLIGLKEDDPLSGLATKMDSSSFIDYFLFTELTKNPDGYRHSTYFYKQADPNLMATSPLFMGPVWDYNIAFGNNYECDGTSTSGWQFVCENPGDGLPVPFWWRKLTTNAEFRQRLASRWAELRADGAAFSTSRINDWIDAEVAKLNQMGAASRNFKRWDVLGRQIPPGLHDENITNYDGEITQLKNWISERTTWMSSNLPSESNEFIVEGIPDAMGGAVGPVGSVALVTSLIIVTMMAAF